LVSPSGQRAASSRAQAPSLAGRARRTRALRVVLQRPPASRRRSRAEPASLSLHRLWRRRKHPAIRANLCRSGARCRRARRAGHRACQALIRARRSAESLLHDRGRSILCTGRDERDMGRHVGKFAMSCSSGAVDQKSSRPTFGRNTPRRGRTRRCPSAAAGSTPCRCTRPATEGYCANTRGRPSASET
jgi:hypothetical protein